MKSSLPRWGLSNLLFGLLSLAIIGGLAWLGWQLLHHAPQGYVLESLRLPATSAPHTLGYQQLGQQAGALSADRQHLQAHFDKQTQSWQLANIAAKKQVWVRAKAGYAYELRRLALQTGDVLQLGEHQLQLHIDGQQLQLQQGNATQIHWDGTALQHSQQANFAGCPRQWRQYLPNWLGRQLSTRLFSLGGKVQCHDRLALANIPLGQAYIGWQAGQFYLYPQGDGAVVSVQRGSTTLYPQHFYTPAAQIHSIIVGRSQYLVQQSAAQPSELLLIPHATTLRYVFDTAPSSPTLSQWNTQAQSLAQLTPLSPPSKTSMFVILLIVLGSAWSVWALKVWRYAAYQRQEGWQLSVFIAVPSTLWLLGLLFHTQLAWLLVCLLLAWAWVLLLAIYQGRCCGSLAWLWLVMLSILGLGALVLSQLAVGANSTRFLGFALRHLQLLLALPTLLCIVLLIPITQLQNAWHWLSQTAWRWWLLSGLAGILVVQVFLGSEQGIAGIQPIELAKTVLVLLLAGFVLNWQEMRQVNAATFRSSPARLYWLGRFLWVLAVAAAMTVVVAFGVRDFSPILIVGGLLLAYLWLLVSWRIRALLITAMLVLLAGGILLQLNPTWVGHLHWLPQPQRLQIWVQPWLYPDTGHQLQLALQAVHGNGSWLGQTWFGANGAVMAIPAIHNDFILAFFLHKAGGLAGLLLLGLQLLWLGVLFMLVAHLRQQAQQQSRQQRLASLLLAYSLYGMAWLLALHWLIAWGNALGLLPIMGQPMTWISSGNSHLLAVGIPSLLLGVLAGLWIQQLQCSRLSTQINITASHE